MTYGNPWVLRYRAPRRRQACTRGRHGNKMGPPMSYPSLTVKALDDMSYRTSTACPLVLLLGLAAPLFAQDAPRTGHFSVSQTLAEVVGAETAKNAEKIISPDAPISWEVYVPPAYDPDDPPGLMVYISPTQSGEMPRGWQSVMDERNLIYIGADRSGNSALVSRRAVFAMVAPTLIGKNYRLNRERIYVTGLSGGGKMASMVATDHAHLFKGAIYNCGVDFWDDHPPRRYEQIKQNRYVFVTGTLDQALEPTKKVHGQYLRAGVENSKLMVIRDMTHKNPNRYDFDEAVAYLDARSETMSGNRR